MRALLLAFGLVALPVAAPAQDAGAQAAIEAVITDQLADFVARDVPGAWEEASPMIQGMFGSPENFGAMVENAYPMVWDNRAAEFQDLEEEAGSLRQTVRVEDPEGRGWLLDYFMVETEAGWKINGVQVRPAPDLSA
jgi:hypothetical protein